MLLGLRTMGSDPEFFIKKGKSFLPSTLFIEGTKEAPEDMGSGFSLLKDNLSIEGNIPAAYNKEEFIANMQFLKNMINTIAAPRGGAIEYVDEATFPLRHLMSEDGQSFGCSSYMNAWTKEEVETPVLDQLKTRQAGCHIHIGYEMLSDKYSKEEYDTAIARVFDAFLAAPSDTAHYCEIRREYYGQLGSYRPKDYGLECRALGAFFSQDKYLGWIYDQTAKVFDYVNENIDAVLKTETLEELLALGINENENLPK